MSRAIAGVLALALFSGPAAATASENNFDQWARTQLSSRPAVRAAELALAAERRNADALVAGSAEWTASAGLAQRRLGDDGRRAGEWELALQRPWRTSQRQTAAASLAQARVLGAEALLAQARLAEARALLERLASWQRDDVTARLWTEQVTVLEQQQVAMNRRLRQGDVARVEALQINAALGQARAQAQWASARREAAKVAMQAQFGSLPPELPSDDGAADGEVPEESACESGHPELRLAEAEHTLASAQSQVDASELSPEITWGWKLGGVPRTGERVVGIMLSVPLPGSHRTSLAEASALRQQSSAAVVEGRRAALRAELLRQRVEFIELGKVWRRADESARQLANVATSLDKGWTLGEGQLQDVLVARRAAIEQRLAAALIHAERRATEWRLRVECGDAWR